MKFAAATPAAGRNATREKQRRARLAAPSLQVRFPGLAMLQLDFRFSDAGSLPPSSQSNVMHPPANAYFSFACPYGDCDGEFDLAESVASVLKSREAVKHGQLHCAGTRRGRLPCKLCLDYTITPSWR